MNFIAIKTGDNNEVISQGTNVYKVIRAAKESGHDYLLTYETPKNQAFIS